MYRRHPLQNNFQSFLLFSIYQVSFFVFITTIGLNIIFGIIVDTFSELRDLKVYCCINYYRYLGQMSMFP